MTLSELVFTIRGRENVEDADAALLEDAEQAVPAVLAGGARRFGPGLLPLDAGSDRGVLPGVGRRPPAGAAAVGT